MEYSLDEIFNKAYRHWLDCKLTRFNCEICKVVAPMIDKIHLLEKLLCG